MSSNSSVLALSNPVFACTFLATCAVFAFKRIQIDKVMLIITFVYVCFTVGYMVKFGWLNFTASMRTIMKIWYAYMTIKIVGHQFMEKYEDIIYKVALISLPLFLAQLAAPDLMMSLNGFLEPIIPQVEKGDYDYSNSFIFTVNPWALDRNSGCMWEPGGFSAVLGVALFINLIKYKFKLNFRFLILTLAMVTTFSTTGYALLLIVMVFYCVNSKMQTLALTGPLIALGVMYVLSLDFMLEKIEKQFNDQDRAIESAENHIGEREGISVGRFASFTLDFNDLMNHPILGYGLQDDERFQNRYIRLVRANGFSDYMVKFGMFGIVFLIVNLYITFKSLNRIVPIRAVWLGVLVVIGMSFSNPLLVSPVFYGFQFYHFAYNKKKLNLIQQYLNPRLA